MNNSDSITKKNTKMHNLNWSKFLIIYVEC